MVKTITDKRLDDHSKRIAALEQSQIHFANEQKTIGDMVGKVYGYMFGSDGVDRSMKTQVSDISTDVKQLIARFDAFEKDKNEQEEATRTIRADAFSRIGLLEDWRKTINAGGSKWEGRVWAIIQLAIGALVGAYISGFFR